MNPVVTIAPGMAGLRKDWGERIRRGRKLLGYSQPRFAQALGVSQSTVCRWENGNALPKDANKPAIANLLGQDVRDLFPLPRDLRP